MIDKEAKIYIAGHRGLAGSAILRKYQQMGYKNLVLRTHQELDLCSQKEVSNFFSQEIPEYVIIAAARVGGIKANMTHPAEFLYDNLMIQTNIIQAALRFGAKKLLFMGSSCIYPRECPQPMKEEYLLTGKLEPTNEAYAIAKITGLKLCEYIYNQFGRKFISVMPTTLYGINDNFDPEESHVLPSLIRKMLKAKKENAPFVEIWGTGNARREFLNVDDLADAIYFLMENYDSPDFINIGVGQDITIRELVELVKKVTGYSGELVFDTTKPDGMPRKLMDTGKLEVLGWKPKIGLEEGIKQEMDWFLSTNPEL
jgi:GDP-L-fucose synthase